jgi:hypothetical protein
MPNVLDTINGPFHRFFGRDLSSWNRWFSFLRIFYGLELSADDLELFTQCTGRPAPNPGGYFETWCISGRQSGKSSVASVLSAHELIFGDWPTDSSVLILSPTLHQSQRVYQNCLRCLSMVKGSIKKSTKELTTLSNGRTLQALAASPKTARGNSAIMIILDEVQSMDSEACPVDELMVSLTPSVLPGGRILGLSSAGPSCGFLWEQFQAHYGIPDDEILVWKSPTALMNEKFGQGRIDRAVKKDSLRFGSEYNSIFRPDITLLFPRPSAIAECATAKEFPPKQGVHFFAHMDVSSGGHDAWAMALVKMEFAKIRVCKIQEAKPPFYNIENVVGQFAETLHKYGVAEATADFHSQVFVETLFRKQNIKVKFSDASSSDLLLALRDRVALGEVELIPDKTLMDQLGRLRLAQTPGGKPKVTMPRPRLDDVSVAVAGAVNDCHEFFENRRRSPAPEPVVVRHTHPDPVRERQIVAAKTNEECEAEWKAWAERDLGPLSIPMKGGREYTVIRRRQ